jgi:hypothetical protein
MWTPSDALKLIDELSEVQFPPDLFEHIHPKKHSMGRYRKYCESRQKRFTRASSSQVLCERMHLIIEYARTSMSAPVGAATWLSVVADAVKRAGDGCRRYGRLSEQHQRFLAEQIAKLVEVAIDCRHPMRWVAEWQIRNTLWRWTVDGVSSNGAVVVDAAKADVTMCPITPQAQTAVADRTHEHVVPRMVITHHLLEQRMTNLDEIMAALRRHCLAAVITKDDNRELNRRGLRQSMPDGWRWGDDPWARYRAANLYDALIWPGDWPRDE